jgi:hypothetical protein
MRGADAEPLAGEDPVRIGDAVELDELLDADALALRDLAQGLSGPDDHDPVVGCGARAGDGCHQDAQCQHACQDEELRSLSHRS